MDKRAMYRIFTDSIVGASTNTAITCGFCDTEHFVDERAADGAWADDEESYQDLEAQCAKRPSGFVRHFEPIGHGKWGGVTVVPACDCSGMRDLAGKIWQSRTAVSSFLNTMLKKRLNEAQEDLDRNMVVKET